MYDIFISYRRKGGAQYARILQLELQKYGYNVFLDYEELKDGKFGADIKNAIHEAPVFLAVLSKNYFVRCRKKGDWVRREIEQALGEHKHIVPINPDGIFAKIPFLTPKNIKDAFTSEQRSQIDFGHLFSESVRQMVEDRISQYCTGNDLWCNAIVLNKEPLRPEQYIHVVLFGSGDTSEKIAQFAALSAHSLSIINKYPTKISIIDTNIKERYMRMRYIYKSLFDISCVSYIDIENENNNITSNPNNSGFPDVEWEFIDAPFYSGKMFSLLDEWAYDSQQQLSIAFAYEDNIRKNIEYASHLPQIIYEQNTPIHVKGNIFQAFNTDIIKNIQPLINFPYEELLKYAKRINLLYTYDGCDFNIHQIEDEWQKKSTRDKRSLLLQVMSLSVICGIVFDNASKLSLSKVSNDEFNALAEQEHNRWVLEKLLDGWRPCTNEEWERCQSDNDFRRMLRKKRVHPMIRPFNEIDNSAVQWSYDFMQRLITTGLIDDLHNMWNSIHNANLPKKDEEFYYK